MYKFNNIIICLDLTEMDEVLIKYANYIVQTFNPQKITFIHVMKPYNIPAELAGSFPDVDRPIHEIIKEDITDKIEACFEKRNDVTYEIILERGATTEKIIQYARKNNTDITVLGKKVGYSGEGGVTRKVVGLVPSSVLLISETTQHKNEKIMIRMDFSKTSAIAIRMAKVISGYTGAELLCHYVYKLPVNYFPQQSSHAIEKFKKKLGKWVDKEYKRFLEKEKLEDTIPCSYSIDMEGEEAQIFYNQAIKEEVDLVLIGSMIKSPLANIIMDSTTEKLTAVDKNMPIMIVKDQKQSIGFLKALFD